MGSSRPRTTAGPKSESPEPNRTPAALELLLLKILETQCGVIQTLQVGSLKDSHRPQPQIK